MVVSEDFEGYEEGVSLDEGAWPGIAFSDRQGARVVGDNGVDILRRDRFFAWDREFQGLWLEKVPCKR
jgi:hypothetical protein